MSDSELFFRLWQLVFIGTSDPERTEMLDQQEGRGLDAAEAREKKGSRPSI